MNPEPQNPTTPTISLELTPQMGRFFQCLQDRQALEMKSPANDQIWDYIISLKPEENQG
jgi:hypothetical protein